MNRLTSNENPTTLRTQAKMARERLQSSRHKVLNRISCDYQDGVLVLYGRVFCFREKQIARESCPALRGRSKYSMKSKWTRQKLRGDTCQKPPPRKTRSPRQRSGLLLRVFYEG